MLQVTNKKMKDVKYTKLILYSLLRCDTFTLKIPDFYSKISSNDRSDDFLKYKQEINWIVEDIKPYVFKEYNDTEYFGSSAGYYSEIIVGTLNLESSGMILAAEGLYSWQHPDMPEDLCLFSKGKCWLKSVAHEKLCYIYTDSEIEKDILKKVIGLKFIESDDSYVPTLDY
jgi:hypothetical protein